MENNNGKSRGDENNLEERERIVDTYLVTSVDNDGGKKVHINTNAVDLIPPSQRQTSASKLGGRKQSYDENDASVSSHDGDDENADAASRNESSNRFPLTTAEGQMAQNPDYTYPKASLAAKREYNRQNAARARKRAKTLLHTYQEQIQVLTTQLAQLRDQNSYLQATLKSLREENIRIQQSQQAAQVLRRSCGSGQASATTNAAGYGAPPSTMDVKGTDMNTSIPVVNNFAPIASTQNQTIPNLLALLYLTGASIQQSLPLTQQQNTTVSFAQPQVAPYHQHQWFNNHNAQPYMLQGNQQILTQEPPNTYVNQPVISSHHLDASSYLSRIMTLSAPMTVIHPNHTPRNDSTDANQTAVTTATSNTQPKEELQENPDVKDTERHDNPS